jgi:hypothetical protein
MADTRRYEVIFSGKVRKSLKRPPAKVREKFFVLVEQLAESGPACSNWPDYSKLGKNSHHCHLAYHWVACWLHEKETIAIEVYYVGSRENAPY